MARTAKPEVRYAKSGDVHIAYTLVGSGSTNLVVTPGAVSHLDYLWSEPGFRGFFEKVGTFARTVLFDKRGTGLSDREGGIPTYEERMDDIRAVMDAVDFDSAVLFGLSEGAPMCLLFAAAYPSRTRGLIVSGGEAKGTWSPDYPWEATEEQWEASFERAPRVWGTKEWAERAVSFLAPSRLGDDEFVQWLGDMMRMGASPGASIALGKSEMNMDVRAILPAIHVPTLVLHAKGDKSCDVGEGRYIASRVDGARMVELPGADHFFFANPKLASLVFEETRKFVSGLRPLSASDRVLTTILFTDIVDSTAKAAQLGDERWSRVLAKYRGLVEKTVQQYGGKVVKSTGDGHLVTFDGPTRAIRCAWQVSRSAAESEVQIRAGLHTGECVVSPDDIGGIAVHLASRIMEEASPGRILVSSTVRDLVYGSGVTFGDEGYHELKGVDEKWRLFSVEESEVPGKTTAGDAGPAAPSAAGPSRRYPVGPSEKSGQH